MSFTGLINHGPAGYLGCTYTTAFFMNQEVCFMLVQYIRYSPASITSWIVSDIAIFVLKRDVKLPTN